MSENKKPNRWIDMMIIAVVIAVIGGALLSETGSSASDLEGLPAPDFVVSTDGGQELKMADYRGKVVVIDFWATWCGPCKKQMPALQKLHEELGDKIAIVSVNSDDESPMRDKAVTDFLKKHKLTFDVVQDDGSLRNTYKVTAYPTLVIVKPDGVVSFANSGFIGVKDMNELVNDAQGGS